MSGPVKVIISGALVLALGGVFPIAQASSQQDSVPAAEQGAEPAPPLDVTINVSEVTGLVGEECTDATPPVCTWTGSDQFSATDPRLSGTAMYRVIETWPTYEAYAVKVTNDDGAWVGTGRYTGGDVDLYVFTLTGQGAYEGLAAIVTDHRAAGADEEGMKGVIVEGGLPPFPAPPPEPEPEPDSSPGPVF